MVSMFTSIWAGIGEWGPIALQALLSVGVVAYAAALVVRAWTILRQDWETTREHPGPLIGLVCGTFVLANGMYTIVLAWADGMHTADIWWRAHGWLGIPLFVCGTVFPATSPGRKRTAVDDAIFGSMRANPRQAAVAFAVAAGSWLMLPAATLLRRAVPAPLSFAILLGWPLALLAQVIVGMVWWWRHGGYVEIADGQRTRLVPTFLLHPVAWGWLWGTVFAFLVIGMLGQIH